MSWYNDLQSGFANTVGKGVSWVDRKFRGQGGGGGDQAPDQSPDFSAGPYSDGSAQSYANRMVAPGGGGGTPAPFNGAGATGTYTDQTGQPRAWQFSDKTRQGLLNQQGSIAGRFADQSQANYTQLGNQGNAALAGLQAQAQGQNSVSAEQLRQGLLQQQAQQQSIAASNPGNPMAARTAAIQSARLGYGLAGQQAVAGLQERAQAQGQYAQLLAGLRGQDASTAGQARSQAITGYGGGMPPGPEPKSDFEKYGPAAIGAISAASDRRLKTEVRDGSDQADESLKGLRAHFFKYKDEDKHGAGARVGIMAQDLEKAGLKHTVINTPGGKMVHGAQLATALAAMMPGLDKRLSKLEGGGED
jgi:hypothetical protein